MTPTDPLAAAIAQVVGADHCLVEPELCAGYEVDWSGRFHGRARFVVRPADAEQLAAVVVRCAEAGAAVVPQGGNTGLVGGGVPRGGEVVVSLRRLSALGEVDRAAGEVTVGAGTTLRSLQEHVAAADLAFGVDFAARDGATIGGMIATNAGGLHALRYGTMRAQVVGLHAVLASGRSIDWLPGLPKDTAGYHLPSLLVGSEGTLAVVTAARLRLVPRWRHRVAALLGLPDVASAVEAATRCRAALDSLEAAELFLDDGLELVLRHRGGRRPFDRAWPAYLLVECAANADPTSELIDLLVAVGESGEVIVAADGAGQGRLWALRERMSDAIAAEGIPHKLDVGLPLAALGRFEAALRGVVHAVDPSGRVIVFGHLGDGNLHVNLLGPAADDEAADEAVYRLVAEHGGTISAEHGVGIAKRRWLALTRGPAEIDAMRAIKRALDPQWILNPGVVLAPDDHR